VLEGEVEEALPRQPETVFRGAPLERAVQVLDERAVGLPDDVEQHPLLALVMPVQGRRGHAQGAGQLPHGKAVQAVAQVHLAGAGQDPISLFRHVNSVNRGPETVNRALGYVR
jgi:hypothetical protein